MLKMTPQQRADYLANNGRDCPYCGRGGQPDGGEVQIQVGSAYQKVMCLECEGKWTDVYLLTGVKDGHGN